MVDAVDVVDDKDDGDDDDEKKVEGNEDGELEATTATFMLSGMLELVAL